MATYTAATAALALAVRAAGRPLPHRPAVTDVVLLSIATHKLSRMLAKDAVTSPLRAPFTRFRTPAGAGELHEDPQGRNADHRLRDGLCRRSPASR